MQQRLTSFLSYVINRSFAAARGWPGAKIQRSVSKFAKSFPFPGHKAPSYDKKERLVIIGSGWGGYTLLKGIDKSKYEMILISPRNYFTFTPLLPSTSVGTLEFRCAVEPVRKDKLQFVEAACQAIHFDRQMVTCQSTLGGTAFDVPYDRLVIACGAQPNTFGIKGVHEILKDVTDAQKIRERLLECFERASNPIVSLEEKKRLLHFVVVGGGPTGVEFCAELYDFIEADVSKVYKDLKSLVQVSIYDAAPNLLNTFNQDLSDYVRDMFEQRGIQVATKKGVKEVLKSAIKLSDGDVIPYGLLVWSTGLSPNNLVSALNLSKDKMGRILTNDSLQVLDMNHKPINNVYGIGDCASIVANVLPCTAQVAKQKAKYLSEELNQTHDLTFSKPFEYRHRGSMAYIGGWKAVVELNSSNLRRGLLGCLIWRSAYVAMSESVRNKIKIPAYWAMTWFLGRETSRIRS